MKNTMATVRCVTKEINLCIQGVRVEEANHTPVAVLMRVRVFQLVRQHIGLASMVRDRQITADPSPKTADDVDRVMLSMLAIAHDATQDCEFIEKTE